MSANTSATTRRSAETASTATTTWWPAEATASATTRRSANTTARRSWKASATRRVASDSFEILWPCLSATTHLLCAVQVAYRIIASLYRRPSLIWLSLLPLTLITLVNISIPIAEYVAVSVCIWISLEPVVGGLPYTSVSSTIVVEISTPVRNIIC